MWKKALDDEDPGFICGSQTFTALISKNFSIANIILFETTATAFFSYSIVVYGGFCIFFSFLICGGTMFISYLWSGRFCGAMLNPVVPIIHMIKKEKKISIIKGALYIVCQFGGTILGTVIGYYVVDFISPAEGLLTMKLLNSNAGATFFQSFIITFIFCIILLTLISTDVTFVELQLQVWISIPILFTTISILAQITVGANPFLGLIIPFFGGYFGHNWDTMKACWPIVIAPFCGAIAGVYFFEYIYRRFVYVYKQELKEEEQMLKRRQLEQARRRKRSAMLELV